MVKDESKLPLVDYLAYKIGCEYISDLPRAVGSRPMQLLQTLNRTPAEAAPLEEWNDALYYLVGASSEETAQAARTRLIKLVTERS